MRFPHQVLIEFLPWLVAMGCLVVLSGFFSASETALFYLSRDDLRAFRRGGRRERIAAELLRRPNRLLLAILFWNLLINLAYFALSSVVAVEIEQRRGVGAGGLFGLASLVLLILLGEVLPKSLAVALRSWLARLVGIPLGLAVRALDPLAPLFQTVTLLTRRLFWPEIRIEPYLAPEDLERAVAASTDDRALLDSERRVLDHILDLAEIRADELMRPRGSYLLFRPPVSLEDFGGELPPSGYALLAEPHTEEIEGAIPLSSLSDVPARHLEHLAEKPVYLPWCTSAARVLEEMRQRVAGVAVVVDEYGSTIGVITYEDVMDTVFAEHTGRTDRILRARAIRPIQPGRYHIAGMTTMRRLAEYFDRPYEPGGPITLAGFLHEKLERLPQPGDTCRWEDFEIRVVRITGRGRLLLELVHLPHEVSEGRPSP